MSNHPTFVPGSQATLRTECNGVVETETVTILADSGRETVYVAARFNNVRVWRSRLTAL